MSALMFDLKATLRFPLNCAELTPTMLVSKSLRDIGAIKLAYGNRLVSVNDLFELSGSDTQAISFKNASPFMEYIGAGMTGGTITIEGDAGSNLGFDMRAGAIHCLGNAGDYAACNLGGGLLTIEGDTGHFLGAAAAGLRKGMRGGTVIVKGNAGDRAGDQMRRGLILIEGHAGAYCGSRMIAGTIGILGEAGEYMGYSMQRGTILTLHTPSTSPTIQDCGAHTLPFLSLLYKSYAQYDTAFNQLRSMRVRRYVGDLACNGNGEILHLHSN
jgi:formylmethanofuran dehydrogenase subunit C